MPVRPQENCFKEERIVPQSKLTRKVKLGMNRKWVDWLWATRRSTRGVVLLEGWGQHQTIEGLK